MGWLDPTPDDHQVLNSPNLSQQLSLFARHLSPALRVDTTLLRNIRLKYFRRSNASLESDLWFSQLVESRSARVISLKPGVARLLTDQLPDIELSNIVAYIDSQTLKWPREIRLEQELRLAARINDKASIQGLLKQVLNWFEYSDTNSERIELLRWARVALPGLIKSQWQLDEALWLMQLAAVTLGDTTGQLADNSKTNKPLPGWLHKHIADNQHGEIGLNLRPGQIEFIKAGTGRHDLPVGRVIPALVGIQQDDDENINWERVWPGKVITIEHHVGRILFTTISGNQYKLEINQNPKHGSLPGQTSVKPEEKFTLYHLKEETRNARTLINRLSAIGISIGKQIYKPDSPPQSTPGNKQILRLWTAKSAQYFRNQTIITDHANELVVRMDKSPLPRGNQNVRSVDLFDKDQSVSDSQLEQLRQVLLGEEKPLTVWLSWSKYGRDLVRPVQAHLENNNIRCIDYSDNSPYKSIDLQITQADAMFVLHTPELHPLIKGDKRISEADVARKYSIPVIHITSEMELSPNALYLENETVFSVEDTLELSNQNLSQLLENWYRELKRLREDRHIYVSYVPEDRQLANTLRHLLSESGWRTLPDSVSLTATDALEGNIPEILNEADCMLTLWPKDPDNTSHIKEEWGKAVNLNKSVSLRIHDTTPSVQTTFSNAIRINAENWVRMQLSEMQIKNSFEYKQLVAAISSITSEVDSPDRPEVNPKEEFEQLLAEIEDPKTKPERRLEIGDRLDEIGDTRKGVGVVEIEIPVDDPALNTRFDELMAELENPETNPNRRLEIGDEFNNMEGGDPRFGVDLDSRGLPEIDWVSIPAGSFIYGDDDNETTMELPAFDIARYPVTNAQFQAFVDDGDYHDRRWWNGLKKPRFKPSDWPQGNRPKINVSWYEAVAFTRWLSRQLNDKTICLPNEYQWERAARGTSGLVYPWGNEYRSGYANVDETFDKDGSEPLGQTTAVGIYRHAASPEGVLDMAGNVWEWCLNAHDKPNEVRDTPDKPALHGGAWNSFSENARAANRDNRHDSNDRYLSVGFRLLRSPSSNAYTPGTMKTKKVLRKSTKSKSSTRKVKK